MKQKGLFNKYLVPSFDETSLFLITFSLILVVIINPDLEFRMLYENAFRSSRIQNVIAGLVMRGMFLFGVYYSIIEVFTKRQKSKWAKSMMLFFAVVMNGWIGFYAASIVHYQAGDSLSAVFPTINMISCGWLLILYRFDLIGPDSISDEDSNINEILVGIIIACICIGTSQFIFHHHWSITISISAGYATIFQGYVSKAINPMGLSDKQEEKQPE